VRFEDEVVADPDGVEAEFLGALGSAEELLAVGVLAEVGQQQSELHAILPWPGTPTTSPTA
jgi:hypothetical protein